MTEVHAIESSLTGLLAPSLSAQGYALVRVKLTGGGRYQTLQVMAERLDGKPITVQDCVAISQTVGTQIEAERYLADSCTLEVSSPGLDRPLVRIEDFERFTGRMATVDLQAPSGERQRFRGRIVRVKGHEADAEIELSTAKGPVKVPMKRIAEARLAVVPEGTADPDEKTERP
jgi:ribosome maturation factor RimP